MRINSLSIAFLIVSLINFGFGLLVIFRSKKKLSNRIFSLLCFQLSIWALISFFIATVINTKIGEFLVRLVFAYDSFIPFTFYIFVSTIGKKSFPKHEKRKIVFLFFLSLCNSILSFSPNFIIETYFTQPGIFQNIKSSLMVKYGKLELSIYLLNILFMLILGLANLYKKKKSCSGILNLEIQYIFLGVSLATIFVITLYIFTIIFEVSITDRLGPFASIIMVGIMIYGISKYKIMDITLVYEKISLYLLHLLSLVIIYFLVHFILNKILIFFAIEPKNWPLFISGFSVAILFNPLKEKIQNFLRIKVLKYDIEIFTQRIFRTLFTFDEIKIIFKNLITELKNFLNVPEKVLFIIKNKDDFPFEKKDLPDEVDVVYKENLTIFNLLEKNKIVIEEEEARLEDIYPDRRKIVEEFNLLGYNVGVAIVQREKIVGGIFLKSKIDNKVFTYRDQLLLTNLGYQLGVSLETLKLYHQISEINSYIKNLLDNATFGVISFDKDGTVRFMNSIMEEILGSSKELLQKHFSQILPEKIIPKVKELYLKLEKQVKTDEIFFNDKIFNIIITSIFDEKEEFLGVQVIFTDITKLRQLEQEIRMKEKLASLGVMAAGLAHEIKNPLVAIKTFVDLLPDRLNDKEFVNEYPKLLRQEIDRINHLIEQILLFSKPQITKMEFVNLNEIIESTITLMNFQFSNKPIRIIKNIPKENVIIKGDGEKLKQVFLNIFMNSFEAINNKKEGYIEVSLSQANEKVEIVISDNGSGIKKEIMDKIFDPFFTTKEKGTGLGLSIVLRILEEHKGKIRIESNLNQGTKVFIEIPKLEGKDEIFDDNN
ncbi:MAG: ATP-binding protein [Candidatus Omnitrophica bacterium]|nr:ATP-binding protein [Candidatus Omnitrophota bacterium]